MIWRNYVTVTLYVYDKEYDDMFPLREFLDTRWLHDETVSLTVGATYCIMYAPHNTLYSKHEVIHHILLTNFLYQLNDSLSNAVQSYTYISVRVPRACQKRMLLLYRELHTAANKTCAINRTKWRHTIYDLYVVGQHIVLCEAKWWRFVASFEWSWITLFKEMSVLYQCLSKKVISQ